MNPNDRTRGQVGASGSTVPSVSNAQNTTGSGQQSGFISLNLQPDEDALGQVTQLIEVDLDGLKLPDFHSSIGTTNFLDGSKVTLSIVNQSHDLQGTAHVDLIKQSWPDIGHHIKMSTALSNELVYTNPDGVTGTVGLTHDVEFGPGSKLEIQLTTDLKTGETTGTVGLKYNF